MTRHCVKSVRMRENTDQKKLFGHFSRSESMESEEFLLEEY